MLFLFSKSNRRLRQIPLLDSPDGMQFGTRPTGTLTPEVAERDRGENQKEKYSPHLDIHPNPHITHKPPLK